MSDYRIEVAKEKVRRAKEELREVKSEVGTFLDKYGWYVVAGVVGVCVIAGVAGLGQ